MNDDDSNTSTVTAWWRSVGARLAERSRSPSVKYNVAANYISQFYVMLIGIVMAPVYLHYMGVEAYGLIGFFTMMSAWFQILDFGLTPTLIRETARFRGGASSATALRGFLRVLEVIFGAISLTGAAAIILGANLIATHWLKVQHLPIREVANAAILMGLSMPMRWVSGLYRSVINGFERQVWLGGYNIIIATVRFVGVLAVFAIFGATPVHFFSYQLFVAAVELGVLATATYVLVPRANEVRERFSFRPLLPNLVFSVTIAVTATIWVALTQTDKLVLSKVLPLADYGVFSLSVVVAGAINSLGIPFGQALLPRLTKLIAETNVARATELYGNATQMVCVLVAPAVTALCFFAEPIVSAWTHNPQIAEHAAPIVRLYAIGNGWVALESFPYYLQYAKGDLRLHFLGNIILMAVFLPMVLWAAAHYGGLGTGAVWMVCNGIYVLAWVPVIHARLFKDSTGNGWCVMWPPS